MQNVFHIGIPKSGTTTIQQTLANDNRIVVTRSRHFTSKDWWCSENNRNNKNKLIIESNETLISGGFQKVKFSQVVERMYKTNKNAKIIITIREQESALLSMYKYHINNNFEGVKSLENWMYNTNLGMDYLSICMYGNIAKILLSYFNHKQIHFLFFEELKKDPLIFYEKFYSILDIPFKKENMGKKALNVMPFNSNQLYTLAKFNNFSISKVKASGQYKFSKIRSFENRIKKGVIRRFNFKAPYSFFSFEGIKGFLKVKKDFEHSNSTLLDLGFVTKEQLETYKYPY